MPAPAWVSEPVPLIAPAKVTASLRLNTSAALSTMSPANAAGGAAIADLQRAGADRRAAGIGVGAGEDQRAGPAWVSAPVPLITPPRSRVSLRLNTKRGVVGDVAEPTLPVVPPLPICSVPALIVVPPV